MRIPRTSIAFSTHQGLCGVSCERGWRRRVAARGQWRGFELVRRRRRRHDRYHATPLFRRAAPRRRQHSPLSLRLRAFFLVLVPPLHDGRSLTSVLALVSQAGRAGCGRACAIMRHDGCLLTVPRMLSRARDGDIWWPPATPSE